MRENEEGQVAPLALGLALVFFAVAGLAVDGTRAFLFRRTLQNAADAAALAGAGEVDRSSYYNSGGSEVVLDPGRAAEVASGWLRARGIAAAARIASSSTRVSVTLKGTTSTLFLRLVGLQEVSVGATAEAAPGLGGIPP